VTIDGTSRIDVSGRGYLGGGRSGNSSTHGRMIGNTTDGGSDYYSGASYGGLGGRYNNYHVNGAYGDLADPNELGSGGGGQVSTNTNIWGGNGGGLVRLQAQELILDGKIQANGMGSYNRGSGSGGGIRLDVGTLSGQGRIEAVGGNTTYSCGAGGGGRIAVYYDSLTLPQENITAAGGLTLYDGNAKVNGGAGTIYLKASSQQYGELVIDNQSVQTRTNSTPMNPVGRGGIISSTPDSLIASGVKWTSGALIGLHFKPDINGPLVYRIADNDANVLYIDPADGDLTLSAFPGNQFAGVYNFDSVTVEGNAQVYCPDQLRIFGDLTVDDAVMTAPDFQADGVILQNGGVVNQ